MINKQEEKTALPDRGEYPGKKSARGLERPLHHGVQKPKKRKCKPKKVGRQTVVETLEVQERVKVRAKGKGC